MRILKETRYEYLNSNYMRENRRGKTLLLVGIPVSILGFCLAIFTTNPSGIGWLALFLGLILSGWGAKYLASSRSYQSGIEGEKAVVEALQELDDSYYLINDIMAGRRGGNIDHVLVSPKGVFVIETKNYTGDVRCEGDCWSKEGKYRPYEIRSVSKQARNNAAYLGDLIRRKVKPGIFVRAICVFTDPGMGLQLHRPTVEVLRIAELAKFIMEAPPLTTLTDSEIQMVAKCIIKEHYKYSSEGQNTKES